MSSVAMSSSPTHSTHSQISLISLQDPPNIHIVQNNKSPRRSVSSPSLRGKYQRAIHCSSDSHPRLNSQDSKPQPLLMNDCIRMKIDVRKLYANMLARLFIWLLAGFVLLPATFTWIRNFDGMGKTGKAVLGVTQNIPFLWVAGFCGASGILWLWRGENYICIGDRIFL